MKSHVWRPLYVVLALIGGILLFRLAYVPADFGSQERGYTFGYHRLGNEQEWRNYPGKFKDSRYCVDCHEENTTTLGKAQHRPIPCENCHGAALGHPEQPQKLAIDRSRGLCLRCHSKLFMPSSGRHDIPGIDPDQHNPRSECVACHNPHNPSLEAM